jgi:hypothetical protein
MRPVTLRGVGVERTGSRHVAVFTLSEAPDHSWIAFFRERARYSVFEAAAATFRRNRMSLELPREEDLEDLIRAVERFIEGANLDVEFRAPQ